MRVHVRSSFQEGSSLLFACARREIYLENNELSSLPESLGELSSLMHLGFPGAMLWLGRAVQTSPPALDLHKQWGSCVVRYLHQGFLARFLLTFIGHVDVPQIARAASRELHLQNNRLISLPESLCNLTRLKHLAGIG